MSEDLLGLHHSCSSQGLCLHLCCLSAHESVWAASVSSLRIIEERAAPVRWDNRPPRILCVRFRWQSDLGMGSEPTVSALSLSLSPSSSLVLLLLSYQDLPASGPFAMLEMGTCQGIKMSDGIQGSCLSVGSQTASKEWKSSCLLRRNI